MMHFHFNFVIFCLALLSLVSIASAFLEGPNVCTRTETFIYQVVVSEQEPHRVTETEWCLSFSLRCSTSRKKLQTVYKTQNLVKHRLVDDCCEGFTINASGDGCSPECSTGCIHGICVAPELCVCEAGFGGPSCDISCPVGFWGGTSSCQNRCQCENNSTCDSFSGECRCSSGWTGEHCENECAQGTYGQDCSEKCHCGNGQCDHVSGECICKSGWMGSLCDVPCPYGKHGSECKSECRCQNDGTCDPESGQCFCQPGWTGPVCANRCPSEFWGANCSLACECHNGASCHHINGECECKPGFVGDTCSESCPDGSFGLNCTERCQCAYGASCSSTTGKCFCPLGWKGDECKERNCPEGLWGPKCESSCDCNENSSVACHPWTGVCECKPGWNGKDCSESLWDLRDIPSRYSQDTFYGSINVTILVVITVIAIGLLLVAIIAIVLYKRKFTIKHLNQYVTNSDNYDTGNKPIYQSTYSYDDDKKSNKEQVLNNSKITNNLYDYKHTTKNDLKSGAPSIDIDRDFAGKRSRNFYSPAPFKATHHPPSVEEMRLLKNDAVNLDVYSASEKEHIYEEIKEREVEYDQLAHDRHKNPQSYEQVTVSVMSPAWQFKPN